MTTSTPGELIWEDLDRQLEQEEAEHEGALTRLKESANVSNYRPVQVPGAVYERLESHAEGTYYMLNNPALGAYLKLEEKDFFV